MRPVAWPGTTVQSCDYALQRRAPAVARCMAWQDTPDTMAYDTAIMQVHCQQPLYCLHYQCASEPCYYCCSGHWGEARCSPLGTWLPSSCTTHPMGTLPPHPSIQLTPPPSVAWLWCILPSCATPLSTQLLLQQFILHGHQVHTGACQLNGWTTALLGGNLHCPVPATVPAAIHLLGRSDVCVRVGARGRVPHRHWLAQVTGVHTGHRRRAGNWFPAGPATPGLSHTIGHHGVQSGRPLTSLTVMILQSLVGMAMHSSA